MNYHRKQTFSAGLLFLLLMVGAAGADTLPVQGEVQLPAGSTAAAWRVALLPDPLPTINVATAAAIGAGGKFTLTASKPGQHYLCLYFNGLLDADAVKPLKLVAGEARANVVLQPQAPRSLLQLALKPATTAVARPKVHLYNEFGEVTPAQGLKADGAGKISLQNLPAGRYDAWVEPGAAVTGAAFHGLAVTSGKELQSLDLTLPPTGAVSGRLLLNDGHSPAAGYAVGVQSSIAAPSPAAIAQGAHTCYATTVTDVHGNFVLAGLADGGVPLDIRGPHDANALSTIEYAPVVADKTTDIGTWTLPANPWQPLFNGKTLEGWKEALFPGHAGVRVEGGRLVLEFGDDMTGITTTRDVPRTDYEISLDAERVDGHDFFCGLTFPVEASPCSLIVGGWGGTVVGLSSIDFSDAANNQTTRVVKFDLHHWYRIRLRVTKEKIEAWIDDKKITDFSIEEHKLTVRYEVQLNKPLGFATWRTAGALRDIRLRRL